jgi:hypothetical protein
LPKDNVLINYIATPWKIESGEIKKDIGDLSTCGYKYEITAYQGEYDGKQYDKNSMLYEEWLTATTVEKGKHPAGKVNYLSIQPGGDIMRCHRVKVGNVYDNSLRERYNISQVSCGYEQNGNTSCGLVQSLYMLGLVKEIS